MKGGTQSESEGGLRDGGGGRGESRCAKGHQKMKDGVQEQGSADGVKGKEGCAVCSGPTKSSCWSTSVQQVEVFTSSQ